MVGKLKIGASQIRLAWAKAARPYLQNNKSKMGWGYGLSSRVPASQCKALSSNLSTVKKVLGPYT
jgi:hypothetical protein